MSYGRVMTVIMDYQYFPEIYNLLDLQAINFGVTDEFTVICHAYPEEYSDIFTGIVFGLVVAQFLFVTIPL